MHFLICLLSSFIFFRVLSACFRCRRCISRFHALLSTVAFTSHVGLTASVVNASFLISVITSEPSLHSLSHLGLDVSLSLSPLALLRFLHAHRDFEAFPHLLLLRLPLTSPMLLLFSRFAFLLQQPLLPLLFHSCLAFRDFEEFSHPHGSCHLLQRLYPS